MKELSVWIVFWYIKEDLIVTKKNSAGTNVLMSELYCLEFSSSKWTVNTRSCLNSWAVVNFFFLSNTDSLSAQWRSATCRVSSHHKYEQLANMKNIKNHFPKNYLSQKKKNFWWPFIKLFPRRQTERVTDHFFKVSYVINENQRANAKACWGSQLFASVQDVPCQFTVNWKPYKGSEPFYIP